MRWEYLRKQLLDHRTWHLPVAYLLLRIGDWWSGVGDYTKLLSRADNIAVLVVLALTLFTFTGSMTDYSFFPEKEWEDLWAEGPMQAIAVGAIFAGRFVFAGILGLAMINPLF